MNLPRELWTTKVQSVPESVRDVIERYLIRIDDMLPRGAGMILSGPTGVGKTCIGSLVLKEARSRGYTTYFISVWELRECIRNRVMFSEELSILDRCRTVDVLVLDGLCEDDGKERFFGSRAIEELVAFRGSHRHATLVTTRMDVMGLRKAMKGFFEATQNYLVMLPVNGPDQRCEKNNDLKKMILGDG